MKTVPNAKPKNQEFKIEKKVKRLICKIFQNNCQMQLAVALDTLNLFATGQNVSHSHNSESLEYLIFSSVKTLDKSKTTILKQRKVNK